MTIVEYLQGRVIEPDQHTREDQCRVRFETLYTARDGVGRLSPYTINIKTSDRFNKADILDTRPGAEVEWIYFIRPGCEEDYYIQTPHWHRHKEA